MMVKKYFLMLMMAFFAISCSKKVEVKGKVTNASPLERIEIIEASGVGTLPLMNVGVNNKGEFSGNFDAPKDGMYILTYGGNMNMIYLKAGQTLNISGNGADFPQKFVITGDAKANNDFLADAEKSFQTYAAKINVGELIAKDEKAFTAQFKKIQTDIFKNLDDAAKKYSADGSVVEWKKDETNAKLLGLLDAYQENHSQAVNNPSFKVSKDFETLKTDITKNGDRMIKTIPIYRDYMLNKLNPDFQKFAQGKFTNPAAMPLLGEAFVEFLKTRKDVSATAKDYFLAYVVSQSDINPANAKKYDQITKLIDENISDATVKKDVKELQKVLMGEKEGTVPNLKLTSADGKSTNLSDLKGKPTVVMFYASWNPNIAIMTIPTLKDVNNFYSSKANFAFVNLDDTKEQFGKTSTAMLKGFKGTNYYVDGGINSAEARKFGLYGFKLPSYIILDKDGKTVGRPFFNLGDEEFVKTMDKLTGLTAPKVQNPMPSPLQMAPQNGNEQPQQAPAQTQPVPAQPERATK